MSALPALSWTRWPLVVAVLALCLVFGQPVSADEPATEADEPAHGETDDQHEAGDHKDDDHEDGSHDTSGHEHASGHSSRLSDVAKPLATDTMPQRPKPLVELGEPFLGTGTLRPGFRLPTGAVWQPSLLVFGTLRTALQTFESDAPAGGRISELATRLDLFANLSLSGSERLVVGIRALDGDGVFTSYVFEHPDPALDGEFRDQIDADIESLFFEGDFGEIFPSLDRRDFGLLDVGFSAGRQPLLFQEGLLINDTLDGIGITRNTLLPANTSNFRATFFYAWDELSTSNGAERDAQLYALLTSTDTRRSTIDADFAYVAADDASGDLLAGGISAVQRIGKANSSFRVLASQALDDETAFASDGFLLFSELSWVPKKTHDLVYFNSFWAIDRYMPAARGVGGAGGGPLGRAGINFASADIGSFDAPLSSQAFDVAGGAVGYQRFLDHSRRQLLIELGFRFATDSAVSGSVGDAFAATVRYQTAHGRRLVLVADGFVGYRERPFSADSETPWGGRLELVFKF